MIEVDFECSEEDASYIDFDITMIDCYKIELIRELVETFELFDSYQGMGSI